jgi:hypothetical protein
MGSPFVRVFEQVQFVDLIVVAFIEELFYMGLKVMGHGLLTKRTLPFGFGNERHCVFDPVGVSELFNQLGQIRIP